MKLIEQYSLWNQEGNADKVYEADLCEVGNGLYVVNFRYGRRGAALKDGSKTAMPVALAKAREIFMGLVNEKTKGGYQETAHFLAEDSGNAANTATQTPENQNIDTQNLNVKEYVLARLTEAARPGFVAAAAKKWPLSRMIWRAGELRIAEAVPVLMGLVTKSDGLQQYCLAWALGRCGRTEAIPVLEQLHKAPASKDFVKRIALAGLLELEHDPAKRNSLVNSILAALPANLQSEIKSGTAEFLAQMLQQALGTTLAYNVLEPLYLVAEDFAHVKAALVKIVSFIPFKPGGFKTARHLFKIAGFREDAGMFAALAYQLEKQPHYFRRSPWADGAYLPDGSYNYVENAAEEMKKPASRLAFSNRTKDYFGRRIWRTLQTWGEDARTDAAFGGVYLGAAKQILLSYSDGKDLTAAKTIEKTRYHWNSETRNYDTANSSTQFDTFANHLTFNHILYQNSPRYELRKNTKAWRCKNNYQPGQPDPDQREEAFPELWDSRPLDLLDLVAKSECGRVHEFAVKALKTRTDLESLIGFNVLMQMLAKPYAVTVGFGLELVPRFYDPRQPNMDLLQLLVHHPLPQARELARQWVQAQPGYFAQNTWLFVDLIVNPYSDVWEWTRKLLDEVPLETQRAKTLIVKCIAELLSLPADHEMASIAAEGAARTLTTQLVSYLKNLNLDIVNDLLQSPLPNVQVLGAVILLNHPTPAENLPPGLIASLVQSGIPQVRQAGVQLFGRLPDATLLKNHEVLSAFCVSPFAEIRLAIQPVIERLTKQTPDFGRRLVMEMLPYLRHQEPYAGLHEDLYRLFAVSLSTVLSAIDQETTLQLLHSNKAASQRLGCLLLQAVPPENLSIRQIVRMAGHEMLEVRQFAWNVFNTSVPRMKYEPSEALRILDAKWDDSRQFAFGYFRQHFSAKDWTPALLVSICDSTRPDVEQFGRELISRFFEEENGGAYLLQLSQHPSANVQLFATNYLEQFATDNPANMRKLENYFITVLAQVNKGGIAKQRVYHLLKQETLKTEENARFTAQIIARQSATMAISHKAACILIMRDIRHRYPDVDLPLVLKKVAAYEPAPLAL